MLGLLYGRTFPQLPIAAIRMIRKVGSLQPALLVRADVKQVSAALIRFVHLSSENDLLGAWLAHLQLFYQIKVHTITLKLNVVFLTVKS